jgi:hypothetical protein
MTPREEANLVIAEEQALTIKNCDGECNGDWDCSECRLTEYMDDPDGCTSDMAYEAACLILSEIQDKVGRCKSIW